MTLPYLAYIKYGGSPEDTLIHISPSENLPSLATGRLLAKMSDAGDAETLIAELKQEITRLSNELEQTTQEKVQAAEYGLVVLEEKQQLQAQYEDIEVLLETSRHELDCAKEVCMW